MQKEHVALLLSMTESARITSRGNVAVVIGGGTGRTEETQEAIVEYISQVDVPLVVDADAIHAIAKVPAIVKDKRFLLTPHTYEFFVLTQREVYKLSDEEKVKIVKEEAEKIGDIILLKGKRDIISDGEKVVLNETGSPYMSVGGTGDTLAGICGALLARGTDFFKAAQAAAYINGKAGERAAERLKESMLATDLIDEIPKVLDEK